MMTAVPTATRQGRWCGEQRDRQRERQQPDARTGHAPSAGLPYGRGTASRSPAIENLQASGALALHNHGAVLIAQFDLPQETSPALRLPQNERVPPQGI
jgi:hypothetical protein